MKKKEKFLLQRKTEKFIKLMIAAGDVNGMIAAYQSIFPQCRSKDSARAGAYRLLQNASTKQAIDEGKRKLEEEIRQVEKEERIRLAKESVAHESELDAIMTEIALGNRKRVKKVVVVKRNKEEGDSHEIIDVEETPTETDQIAAAKELYKRKGSYAPVGIKHEAGDSFLEFIKHAQNLNNNNIPNHVQPGSDK